ncbi:MAG: hypothetical protein JW779_12090, partial [Candidatus Thorarchaeota archaeon]|nr:hypothetical protein [Candidatus Thorarchaeota archaeon]
MPLESSKDGKDESMDDNYGEALDFLRLLPQKGLDSTIGNLLRGLLQVQRNREIGVEFSEVYDRFSEINGGNPKTRPYVHRLLN